jgi:hypothetical protein
MVLAALVRSRQKLLDPHVTDHPMCVCGKALSIAATERAAPVDNFARQPFPNDQIAGRHKVQSGAWIDIVNEGEPTSKYLEKTIRTRFK